MINLSLTEQEKYGLTQEEQEIAIARKLEILILPHLKRNIEFFYGGANIPEKAKAYRAIINKEQFEKTFEKIITPTSCKSVCSLVAEILNENKIQADTVSCDTDIFRHTDVVITTSSGRKYIINYLEDMERVQTAMTTPDFASKPYYDRRYKKFEGGLTTDGKTLKGISFIDERTLDKIDSRLGYKKQNMYMDEVIEQIRREFSDFKNIMAENEWINTESQLEKQKMDITQEEKEGEKLIIYDKFNRMTNCEELEAKLDWIFDYFNDRMNINGHTDFVMYYSQLLLKGVLSDNEYKDLTRYDCFIKREEIPPKSPVTNALDLDNPENTKKVRFCMIELNNGSAYAFSNKPNSYAKLTKEQFDEVCSYTKISKTQKPSDLVLYLCDRGNALPLVFHQIGSQILNERAELIPNDISAEERQQKVKELSDSIQTQDDPVTSILIPYPDGTAKYLYIDKNNEFVVKSNKREEIYHYNEENDEFNIEKVISNVSER